VTRERRAAVTAGLAGEVERLIGASVEAMGFAVVRVQLGGQQRPRLQIMVERLDGKPVEVDDCAAVSRAVSALLDVADPISGAYTLEISSPGIDRPLVRLRDFDRFAGFVARVETDRMIGGRRRFKGRLLGTAEGQVRLEVEGEEVSVPHDDIVRAKLIATDERISAGARRTT
jgi:ribosome maturation factor RimP